MGTQILELQSPESDEEEKKRLYSAYDYRWDAIPQEVRSRLRWKSTDAIAESYTPSWARLTPRQLEEFSVVRDPCDPRFIGYSLTENDQRERNPIEEEGKEKELTQGGNSKEKFNDDSPSGRREERYQYFPSMTTPKRALTTDDLGGHGGEKEPENLQKSSKRRPILPWRVRPSLWSR